MSTTISIDRFSGKNTVDFIKRGKHCTFNVCGNKQHHYLRGWNLSVSVNGSGLVSMGSVTSVGAISTVSIPASSIVGISDSQTLNNKSIDGSQLVDGSVTITEIEQISGNTLLGNDGVGLISAHCFGAKELPFGLLVLKNTRSFCFAHDFRNGLCSLFLNSTARLSGKRLA